MRRDTMQLLVLSFIGLVLWLLVQFLPFLAFMLALGVFLLAALQAIVQLWSASLPPLARKRHELVDIDKLVSVHIPSYDEPPALVMHTLHALTTLSYPRVEVFILDNNTRDRAVWKPVEAYVRSLPGAVRFCHEDVLRGFKAGALNYLMRRTDPAAEYILIADADYEVEPSIIEVGLSYFTDPAIAFVQFPQSYRNLSAKNAGVAAEYDHFFATYMRAGNYFRTVGSTGTLTLYRRSALKRVGGFDARSITEDADIGLRFIERELYGVYADEVVGRGLMPYDLEAYKKQKYRWARGNAALLRQSGREILESPVLTTAQKVSVVAQLTAWLNPTLIPVLFILIIGLVHAVTGAYVLLYHAITYVSLLTLLVFFFLKAAAFGIALWRRHSPSAVLRGFLIHVGTNLVYSLTPFLAVFEREQQFERTNKFILPTMPSVVKNTNMEMFLGGGALALTVAAVGAEQWFLTAALCAVFLINALVFWVLRETNATKEVSARLLARYEAEYRTKPFV